MGACSQAAESRRSAQMMNLTILTRRRLQASADRQGVRSRRLSLFGFVPCLSEMGVDGERNDQWVDALHGRLDETDHALGILLWRFNHNLIVHGKQHSC